MYTVISMIILGTNKAFLDHKCRTQACKQAFPKQERVTVYWHVKWDLKVEKNVSMKVPERRVQTPEAHLHS